MLVNRRKAAMGREDHMLKRVGNFQSIAFPSASCIGVYRNCKLPDPGYSFIPLAERPRIRIQAGLNFVSVYLKTTTINL